MYRQTAAVLIFMMAIAVAPSANATMDFYVDMNQDLAEDVNWPLGVGDTVMVDILVSGIPEPGLETMGFKITYNPAVLSVTNAIVDEANFPSGGGSLLSHWSNVTGEVEIYGTRIPLAGEEDPGGIHGDSIRMATVTFQRTNAGEANLQIIDRDPTFGDFVIYDNPDWVLDDQIGDFDPPVTIRDPLAGDVNGDGIADLADAILTLQFLSETAGGVVHLTGDATGDGVIGVEEGIWILQKTAEWR